MAQEVVYEAEVKDLTTEDFPKMRFVQLPDGRCVPYQVGGMVEFALLELQGEVADVEDVEGDEDRSPQEFVVSK